MAFKSSGILKKVIPKLQLPFVSQMCAKWRQGAFRRCKCIKRKLDNNNVWFHTVHLKIRAHLFPQGQQQHWALVCTCEKFGAPMWKCLVQNTSDQMHEADVTWCWEKGEFSLLLTDSLVSVLSLSELFFTSCSGGGRSIEAVGAEWGIVFQCRGDSGRGFSGERVNHRIIMEWFWERDFLYCLKSSISCVKWISSLIWPVRWAL